MHSRLILVIGLALAVVGCASLKRAGAPDEECRGRDPIPLTSTDVKVMSTPALQGVTAHNENLERECNAKAPN